MVDEFKRKFDSFEIHFYYNKYKKFYLGIYGQTDDYYRCYLILEVREVWQMWHILKKCPDFESIEMHEKVFVMNNLYYKKNQGMEGEQIVLYRAFYDGEKVKKDLRECIVIEKHIYKVFWEGLQYFSEKPYVKQNTPHFHQGQLEFLQCPECHDLPRW